MYYTVGDIITVSNIVENIAVTEVEHKSKVKLTDDTVYFILTDKLWHVYCEDLREILPRYNSTVATQPYS